MYCVGSGVDCVGANNAIMPITSIAKYDKKVDRTTLVVELAHFLGSQLLQNWHPWCVKRN